jgi:methionine-rich copper-binding protein CopC
MTKSLIRAAAAALFLGTALPAGPALAHAELASAVPAADATVSAPAPTELRISFTEEVELAFSKVTVTGPDEQPIETGPLALDPADAKVVIVPMTARLPKGAIKVDWTVSAADTHKSEGSYSFTVAD